MGTFLTLSASFIGPLTVYIAPPLRWPSMSSPPKVIFTLLAFCIVSLALVPSSQGRVLARSDPLTPAAKRAEKPRSFPIYKKRNDRTGDELLAWANRHRSSLLAKHDRSHVSRREDGNSKRAEGSSSLTNYEDDSTWYTNVQVGTPSADYSLVLDTGSSDVWISSSSYTPADSSTFVNKSSSFDISYGSGDVAGYVASETFTIAQHTITGQTFAVATDVGSGLLDGTTDGIVGLGFSPLSVDGAQPIWQAAGETEFSFYLEKDTTTRSTTGGSSGGGGQGNPGVPGRKKRATSTSSETSPGGIFTLGGANTSLYTGDINWLTVTEEAYWTVQLGGVSVQGYSAGIGSLNSAAIDTGTTLIGGPDTIIAALYAQIPNSGALSSAEGYYGYPCDTTINATITFGNQQYTLSSADFEVSEISDGVCLGAFFSVGSVTSRSSLNWIVGDVFLKGVYSIFSAGSSTARVGFASLAAGLNNSTSSTTVAQSQSTSGAVAASASLHTLAALLLSALAILASL